MSACLSSRYCTGDLFRAKCKSWELTLENCASQIGQGSPRRLSGASFATQALTAIYDAAILRPCHLDWPEWCPPSNQMFDKTEKVVVTPHGRGCVWQIRPVLPLACLRLPRFHSSAPFLPLHSFSDTLLCIFSAAANWRGGGGEEELGMPASFHHSLGTGISPSTSSTMPLTPTFAVNPCDLDFKALVFHSHCSLGSTSSQSVWQVARSLWGRREHQT